GATSSWPVSQRCAKPVLSPASPRAWTARSPFSKRGGFFSGGASDRALRPHADDVDLRRPTVHWLRHRTRPPGARGFRPPGTQPRPFQDGGAGGERRLRRRVERGGVMIFIVRLRALPRIDAIKALRRVLKYALRCCGLRCLSVEGERQ